MGSSVPPVLVSYGSPLDPMELHSRFDLNFATGGRRRARPGLFFFTCATLTFSLSGTFQRLQQPPGCAPPPINTRMRRLPPFMNDSHPFLFFISAWPHMPLFSISLLFFCPSAPPPPGPLSLPAENTHLYIFAHTQERSCTALAFSQQRDAALLL